MPIMLASLHHESNSIQNAFSFSLSLSLSLSLYTYIYIEKYIYLRYKLYEFSDVSFITASLLRGGIPGNSDVRVELKFYSNIEVHFFLFSIIFYISSKAIESSNAWTFRPIGTPLKLPLNGRR